MSVSWACFPETSWYLSIDLGRFAPRSHEYWVMNQWELPPWFPELSQNEEVAFFWVVSLNQTILNCQKPGEAPTETACVFKSASSHACGLFLHHCPPVPMTCKIVTLMALVAHPSFISVFCFDHHITLMLNVADIWGDNLCLCADGICGCLWNDKFS